MTALNMGGIELADLVAERLPTPPSNAEDGRIYYDTTLGLFQFRQNSAWGGLGGAGSVLSTSGGTMTGPLILNDGSPAASRTWTLNTVSSGGLPVLGVTFNIEVYGAVGDGVTDDYAAIRDAWNAMLASPFGGVLFCPRAVVYRCVVDGRLIHQTDGQYCVFPIPVRVSDGTHPKVRYGIVGVGEAYVTRNYGGTSINTALHTTSSTIFIDYSAPFTYSASFGHPSFIGAPDADKAGLAFSNTHFSVEHMTFRQPNNPSVASVNLDNVSSANVYDFCGDINAPLDTSAEPTHPTGVPLLMPRTGNAIDGQVDKYLAWGYYGGYPLTEHSDGCSIQVVACRIGAFFRRSNVSHPYHIARFFMEECPWGIAGLDPTAPGPNGGVVTSPNATLIIDFWDIEDFNRNGTANWMYPGGATKKAHVLDTLNALKGGATALCIDSGPDGRPQTSLYVSGGLNFSLFNMQAPGTALTRLVGGVPAADSPPNTPTIGTATAGNASATVSFTPSGTGAVATSFTVTSTPGGITATGASSPITVNGLTNGTTYTFTVHATNGIGSSGESAASNAVTPSGAGATYVADTYTRANGAIGTPETGPAYVDHSVNGGDWEVNNNQAFYNFNNGSGGSYSPVVVDTGHTSYTITAKFVLTNDGGGGDQQLVVAYVANTDLVMVDVSGNDNTGWVCRLFQRLGNVFTGQGSLINLTGVTSANALVVKIVKVGAAITATYSVDGGADQAIASFNCDVSLQSSTLVGLMSEAGQKFTRFDNLLVTA